jgi:hypothetical protein
MMDLTVYSIERVTRLLIFCLLVFAGLIVHAREIPLTDGCTLDDAITSANRNRGRDDCRGGRGDMDEIKLHENVLISGRLPTISSNIIIEGNHNRITMKSDHAVFVVNGGSLVLKDVSIRFRKERTGDILEIKNAKLTLINVNFQGCTGSMKVENSSLEMQGYNYICGHSREVIDEWFGPIAPPTPRPQTCAMLTNATVIATYGLGSGINCQHATIVPQSVIDMGFIDAIDLSGYAEQGIEVCFHRIGATVFLDAATSPRALSSLDSYRQGNTTCAKVNRPGTVVLVAGQPTTVKVEPVVSEPATAPVASEPAVEGCSIRTTGHINFRAAPSLDAEKLGVVLRGTTLGAISRIWGWYQVIHLGRTGWIGGKYVDNIGNCQ